MELLKRRRFVLFLLLSIFFIGSYFVSIKFSTVKIINVTIQNQKLVKPLSPIIIEKGKEVRLRIQSDQEEDFHLEGYHAFSPLKTDRVMILEFEALTVGSFPFYLDRSHTYLGSFEIVE